MEFRTSPNTSDKNDILERKKTFKIIIWFCKKLTIELWRYINDFDSSISDVIDDFKNNGPTTLQMHQLYGFSKYQKPTVLGLFGYKSLHVWNISSITSLLESNISYITDEFVVLKKNCLNFEKLRANSKYNHNNSYDNWKVYHLIEEGLRNEANLIHCPTVSKVLDSLNICACSLGYAYFSVLSANTTIEPHYGVTNVKLRIQIPLLNQSNINKCYITINNIDYHYEAGKVIIFDDSYLHSVRNDSNQDRVVLLIDIWHPDLSQHTIQALTNYFYNGCGLTATNLLCKPDHFVDNNVSHSVRTVGGYDYLFKFLMIGQNGVGKSSLLMRYAENYFTDSFRSTIGVDFKIKTVQIRDKVMKFQIWDPAGPERFRTITSSYYRGAHIILILVDLADPYNATEFERVTDHCYEGCMKHAGENVTIMLVGTKADLKDRRVVSYERIINYANNNKIPYIETSSKDNINVQEAFITAARIRYQKIEKDAVPIVRSIPEKTITNKKTTCVIS